MKTTKLISLFLALIMALSIFVSCGEKQTEESSAIPETEEAPKETKKSVVETIKTPDTSAETADPNAFVEPTVDLSKFYSYKVFDLPEDFRQAAVDYMRYQAGIVWTPGQDIKTSEKFEHENWGIDLTYKAGVEYQGLPYANTYVTVDEFEQFYLDADRKLVCDSQSWQKLPGLECGSSIVMALQQFSYVYGYTDAFNPGTKDKFRAIKVGDYTAEPGQSSAEICKANKAKGMFEAYSHLDKGDVLFHGGASGSGNHVRMISENHVERKSDGSIDSRKSYVLCLEQTNAFDKDRKGVNSTWRVDKKYGYEDLFTQSYVPVTLREYNEGRKEKIYLGLSSEILAEDLAQKAVVGQVETNSVLRYVYLDILTRDGRLVSRKVAHGVKDYSDSAIGVSTGKIDLRKYGFNLFDGVAAGDYTFVLSAGIAAGSAELARVDFTLQ